MHSVGLWSAPPEELIRSIEILIRRDFISKHFPTLVITMLWDAPSMRQLEDLATA